MGNSRGAASFDDAVRAQSQQAVTWATHSARPTHAATVRGAAMLPPGTAVRTARGVLAEIVSTGVCVALVGRNLYVGDVLNSAVMVEHLPLTILEPVRVGY